MASITPNNRSMNGINQIETSSISFPDGTTINTNDFASQADANANQAAIAANTSSLSSKEDLFSVSGPLVKTIGSPNSLSIDTNTVSGIASGNNQLITGGGIYRYLLLNYNAKLSTDSPQQLQITDSGTGINIDDKISVVLATNASQTDFGLVTGKVLADELANQTYTAATNGGLSVNPNNEFSINFNNTNQAIIIPQQMVIQTDATPQLLVYPAGNTGRDGVITIRGARNATNNQNQAQLHFENYDNDLSSSNKLGRLSGMVINRDTNIGGLVFDYYSDGQTPVGAMTMSSNGNFNIGRGTEFQNTYNLQVGGSVHLGGANYIKPQMRIMTFDKDIVISTSAPINTNWGNGSTQPTQISNRQIGDSFSTGNSSTITLTKNGYYRIKVAANVQSDEYNNRIAFMNYLNISGTDYNENENYNFFSWCYTRNTSDGAHGNNQFEDYIYLTSGDSIQVRNKLGTGDDRLFNNSLAQGNIDNYLTLTIERIYETNPEAAP